MELLKKIFQIIINFIEAIFTIFFLILIIPALFIFLMGSFILCIPLLIISLLMGIFD